MTIVTLTRTGLRRECSLVANEEGARERLHSEWRTWNPIMQLRPPALLADSCDSATRSPLLSTTRLILTFKLLAGLLAYTSANTFANLRFPTRVDLLRAETLAVQQIRFHRDF